MATPALICFTLFVALVVALVLLALRGPVSQQRVERFARRQRLTITATNREQVVRYLATTRRWRVLGLLAGVAASQIPPVPPGSITHLDAVTIFAGWFLGALVAEIRVEHLAHGRIRMASLRPRRPERYVRRFAWALVPASAVVVLITGAATAGADLAGWAATDRGWATVWLVAAIAVAVAVRLIQRAVLRRAQPVAAPDVIEADDAIRSRSLHVLSGGGAALVLFLTLRVLDNVHPIAPGGQLAVAVVQWVGVVAIPLLGWIVATSLWPPPGYPAMATVGTA